MAGSGLTLNGRESRATRAIHLYSSGVGVTVVMERWLGVALLSMGERVLLVGLVALPGPPPLLQWLGKAVVVASGVGREMRLKELDKMFNVIIDLLQ